ncbi:sialidase family protein [Sphingobacterium sp. HJSM2_6]|uniref:sialidase family protein n=1 Tax=Sphingobacterium sp. HJSM2_6 TaxID=3366264 RepID=UPI003BBCA315
MLLLFVVSVLNLSAQHKKNENDLGYAAVKKIKDILIYEDPQFYVAFPSIVKTKNEFLVAFRRAPNRTALGENYNTHTDPNSYLVMLRSTDGEHWGKNPETIYAYPFGGSQDPCLLRLRDGTLLCTSYGWAPVKSEAIEKLKKPVYSQGGFVAMGGYLVRSFDEGKTWSDPIYPPQVKDGIYFNALGNPMPAYNRGALFESKTGRIFWVVAAMDDYPLTKTSNHLLYSDDKGLTWTYSAVVASDPKIVFNEASVYETPKGDIVAFIRTENKETQACIARSTDGGKTFTWKTMGFYGHPLAAVRLPDQRVLLTYGYRQNPCGIRARILNAECTDFASAEEIILRDDNGPGTDVGYSWPVVIDKNRALVVYYMTKPDGMRVIAGTLIAF